MSPNSKGLSIGARLAALFAGAFLAAAAVLVYLTDAQLREQALAEAEAKAILLLERNLATHAYFAHELKPKLFELAASYLPPGYFDPTWMSSTYAIRRMNQELAGLGAEGGVYYKECAVNARDPHNEADEFERAFLDKLNRDPAVVSESTIRVLDGKQYFCTLRRGETMGPSCLRCHSLPANAPVGLVDIYGPERSFGRRAGEVVSAVSIRVPLSSAYERTHRFSFRLSLALVGVLVLLYASLYLAYGRVVGRPLSGLRAKALQIAESETHLGEAIPVSGGAELEELASAFNTMSERLRDYTTGLEEKIRERTAALERLNQDLTGEVEERRKAEQEKEAVIADLKEAAAQIRSLRGLIPICAWCKKIRDDTGYWNELESYLKNHSEAEFSHGICPACAEKVRSETPQG